MGIFRCIAGTALALTLAAPAHACTLANWSDTTGPGLSAGGPGDGHRRYSGACGLKVQLGDNPTFLTDSTPAAEDSYLVRFYLFTGALDLHNGGFVDVFAALAHEGNNTPEFSLRLKDAGPGPALVARARDGAGYASTDPVVLAEGWHALEVHWQAARGGANGRLEVFVDGVSRGELQGLANSGRNLEAVRLGAVHQAGAAGSLDFDAFVSHRATPVGELLRGDASGDRTVDAADLVALVRELEGRALAAGQPDCTGDGAVNGADLPCTAAAVVGR